MEPKTYEFKDKVFTFVGLEDYTTKAGLDIRLCVWQRGCSRCGELYQVKVSERVDPKSSKAFYTKHCKSCAEILQKRKSAKNLRILKNGVLLA